MQIIRRTAVLALLTAALALSGGAAANATPAGHAAPAADLPAPTGTGPVTGAPNAGPAVLVGVRVGRHDDYDRTVFDFTGGTPGYRVEYGPVYTEGRGDLVHLEGTATLSLHFNPAYAHDLETGAPTVDPGLVLTPRYPALRQVKLAGDFEGYVSAGIGVSHRVGFRVFTLTGPYRLVVDVAHRGG
jgi:hypothetical protein